MDEVVGDCCAGGADIKHGDVALHFVMSGFVEEVAETDDANCFAREVQGQCAGVGGEYTRDRIQFLTAGVQVVFGYDEIGSAEGGVGGEEDAILAVPKAMIRGLRQRSGLD